MDAGSLLLYLVTDPVLGGSRGVEEACRQALAAGVTSIQLRDKTASTRDLLRIANVLRDLCHDHGALFFVNDRVDVALASRADGVHVGQDDMPATRAREMLGEGSLIGVSVRTVEEAVKAWKDGADYIAANMIFSTATKTDLGEPLGLKVVRKLKDSTPLPLVAIGGIDGSNAGLVRRSGADGIAVVSAIMGAGNIAAAVKSLLPE